MSKSWHLNEPLCRDHMTSLWMLEGCPFLWVIQSCTKAQRLANWAWVGFPVSLIFVANHPCTGHSLHSPVWLPWVLPSWPSCPVSGARKSHGSYDMVSYQLPSRTQHRNTTLSGPTSVLSQTVWFRSTNSNFTQMSKTWHSALFLDLKNNTSKR